jgi:hypothetical protein
MKERVMKKGEGATMELLFTNIIIVELVALQYLIIVFLFLLACPACPKRSTRSSKNVRITSVP